MAAGSSIDRIDSAPNEVVAAAANPATESVPVRIIVFNDHPVFKSALSWKITEESGVEFVADTVSLSETLQTVAEQPGGVIHAVVADLRIGDGNSEGVESVRTLVSRLKGVPVVVCSDYFSRSYAKRMVEAGAAAMVQKSSGIEKLTTAILEVASEAGSQTPKVNGSAA